MSRTPVERLQQITAWFEHNQSEMSLNHRSEYLTFVADINTLWSFAQKMDKMHEKGEK